MCCIVNDGDCKIYYFIMQKYYFNEQNRKIKSWDVGSIIKLYYIIDKVAF